MSPTVINYIKSSLVYLALGVTMGLLMSLGVFDGREYVTTLHAHINLLGWISMLIFGVAFHILPRFSGRPLHNEKMASVQLWLNNIGLAGMVVTLLAGAFWNDFTQSQRPDFLLYGMAPFGGLFAVGTYLFVFNLWKTLAGALPPVAPPGGGR